MNLVRAAPLKHDVPPKYVKFPMRSGAQTNILHQEHQMTPLNPSPSLLQHLSPWTRTYTSLDCVSELNYVIRTPGAHSGQANLSRVTSTFSAGRKSRGLYPIYPHHSLFLASRCAYTLNHAPLFGNFVQLDRTGRQNRRLSSASRKSCVMRSTVASCP